jgi:tRNA 2-thiouridine synthesizing protein A
MFPCETRLAVGRDGLDSVTRGGPVLLMSFSSKENSTLRESAALELDLRGLKCPLPAIKTRAALDQLSPGVVLAVATTDPLASIDIPHAAQEQGDELLETRSLGRATIFLIRRGSSVSRTIRRAD